MMAILALAQKDLRLLLRDKGDVFFTFVFPMILAIFFGFVFGGGGGTSKIDLALVVESDARIAAGIAADLESDASFQVTRFDTRDAAIDSVRAGKSTAAVILPIAMQDGIDGLFSGTGIPMDAIVDPSHRAEAGLIQGKLNELAFRQLPKLFADGAQMAKLFDGARKNNGSRPRASSRQVSRSPAPSLVQGPTRHRSIPTISQPKKPQTHRRNQQFPHPRGRPSP